MDTVWKMMKNIKSEASTEKECTFDYGINNLNLDTETLVASLEQQLKIELSEIRMENLTNGDLTTPAKMFTYFLMCHETVKPWLTFYKDLFATKPIDEIILTLNRMSKIETLQNKVDKDVAVKLLKKAATMFSLKFVDIQRIITEDDHVPRTSKEMKVQGINQSEGM